FPTTPNSSRHARTSGGTPSWVRPEAGTETASSGIPLRSLQCGILSTNPSTLVGEPPDVPVVIVKELRSIASDHRSGSVVLGPPRYRESGRASCRDRAQVARR